MAGPNDKAFKSMLRSSKIKKSLCPNATSKYERDIKTMSELAGDMARGMKISKHASGRKARSLYRGSTTRGKIKNTLLEIIID